MWVNIIGLVYGIYNMLLDLYEVCCFVEGIGVEINMIFFLGSYVEDLCKLVDVDVNICFYWEFGWLLCEIFE